MALEATHIRFALDLQKELKVSDMKKYLSGSIYPDSRYITKIERTITHPKVFLDGEFELSDDFRKGWFTHLLCDQLLNQITSEKLPEIFAELSHDAEHGGALWIHLTALKILQDMDDVKNFDIGKYLQNLDYAENPHQENLNFILKFNRIFQEMYRESPSAINFGSYEKMWIQLGIGSELSMKIKNEAENYAKNKKIMNFIAIAYLETLKRAKRLL